MRAAPFFNGQARLPPVRSKPRNALELSMQSLASSHASAARIVRNVLIQITKLCLVTYSG